MCAGIDFTSGDTGILSKKAFKFNKTLLCVLILAAALLLAGCGGAKSTRAKADETVHTALFDFTCGQAEVIDSYNGIDIPAKLGTPVYAANAGTVVIATSHWSYGNYIMIDHGGGVYTLYAHNSKLCVKVGDKVKRGQVIAKAGSTGQSTGSHCHFSIRENGEWINHKKYFPD